MSRSGSNFGSSVSKALAERGRTQASLADELNVTRPYVNALVTGRKQASPGWVDLVATALRLSDEQKKKLHAAAARDAGYDIEL